VSCVVLSYTMIGYRLRGSQPLNRFTPALQRRLLSQHTIFNLTRDISRPEPSERHTASSTSVTNQRTEKLGGLTLEATPAAIEACKAEGGSPLANFHKSISLFSRPPDGLGPRISLDRYAALFEMNQHEHGCHFVVHQHNHPTRGVHYDLRLQISETSSFSFALPKGLPGIPNSSRPTRLAIEARVHSIWSHLIENASRESGSLLIWDAGTYSILPREASTHRRLSLTDNEPDADLGARVAAPPEWDSLHENEKLMCAFRRNYICVRLDGTRLPADYTMTMHADPINTTPLNQNASAFARESHWQNSTRPRPNRRPATDSVARGSKPWQDVEDDSDDLDTDSEQTLQTCLNNAYPGLANTTTGSTHRRRWSVRLDRWSSGFIRDSDGQVVRGNNNGGFEPFLVRGSDYERSVVTGRLAAEIERDAGLVGFVGKPNWRGVTE
jgi:hypothetical protein